MSHMTYCRETRDKKNAVRERVNFYNSLNMKCQKVTVSHTITGKKNQKWDDWCSIVGIGITGTHRGIVVTADIVSVRYRTKQKMPDFRFSSVQALLMFFVPAAKRPNAERSGIPAFNTTVLSAVVISR